MPSRDWNVIVFTASGDRDSDGEFGGRRALEEGKRGCCGEGWQEVDGMEVRFGAKCEAKSGQGK
jgi:hypothetical protein